ncbi:MAG: arylsulfatase [Bacteroidetes bacterium]|nr:arylsulfatase [Bacteroidota bacterium]
MKLYFLSGVVLIAALVAGFTRSGTPTAPPTRPNVLFILTDDQGWGDLSLHGNPILQTPQLDSLARSGAMFDRFYVSPLCAPTRASLLTGRYHLRTGTVSVSRSLEVMDAGETTLAEIFKANGYATGCFGKWHNGEHYPNTPNGQGFGEFLGFCAGHLTNYFDSELSHNGQPVSTKGYITDVLTDAALNFMEKNAEKPFFCYVPYNAPHTPHQVPEVYFQKHKKAGLSDELASIYGMVENVDDNVGRLLRKLHDLGLDKNTIVVFATDNGPNGKRYNGDMKGVKGHVDEGGVRVPFFISWPDRIKPQTVQSIAAHIDLLPSLVELCDFPKPDTRPLDGKSFAKIVLGKEKDAQQGRTLFTQVASLDKNLKPTPGAVRTPRYRWVWKGPEPELYDMKADPGQKNNLATTETALTQNFLTSYQRWFADVTEGLSLRERPAPVGYPGQEVELAAHEANFSGGLKYVEGHGWAHDWLVHWTSPVDRIEWQVQAAKPTRYSVYLRYTCRAGQTGAVVRLTGGGSTVEAKITEAYDPPLTPSPDRVPRKEAFEKPWKLLKLGELTLPAGPGTLSLQATEIPAGSVAEVKSLVLRPIGE